MTIEEAIDSLAEERDFELGQGNKEMVDSIKLGIEALKRVWILKQHGDYYVGGLLPGETEEKGGG